MSSDPLEDENSYVSSDYTRDQASCPTRLVPAMNGQPCEGQSPHFPFPIEGYPAAEVLDRTHPTGSRNPPLLKGLNRGILVDHRLTR
jgi:hypothetical protein